MECEYQIKGNMLRIVVPMELDHHVSSQIQQETDLLVRTYFIRKIVFDFARTQFMDSSGIGVILGRYKHMAFSGGTVAAWNLNERMQKIFLMSGLDHLIEEAK
jgi:stage II sporulation protein AA (anti-sigma F factor antagonist)